MYISGLKKRVIKGKTEYDVAVRHKKKSIFIKDATILLPKLDWIEHPKILKPLWTTRPRRDAIKKFEEWKKYETLKDANIFLYPKGIIHFWGDLPEQLKPFFECSPNNSEINQTEMANWLIGGLFRNCELSHSGDMTIVKILNSYENPEIIKQEAYTAIDTEAFNWDKYFSFVNTDLRLDEINQYTSCNIEDRSKALSLLEKYLDEQFPEQTVNAGYLTKEKFGNYSITSIPAHSKILTTKGLLENIIANIIEVDNNLTLVQKLVELVNEHDPFFISGHHIMGYDFRVLDDLTEEKFSIGVDGSKASKKGANIGVLENRPVFGRVVLDGAAFAQNRFPGTENNKLVTCTGQILNLTSGKSLTYAGVNDLHATAIVRGALSTNKVSENLQVLDYMMGDMDMSYHFGKYMIDSIIPLMLLYGQEGTACSFTSNKNLGKKAIKQLDFKQNLTITQQDLKLHSIYRKFSIGERKKISYQKALGWTKSKDKQKVGDSTKIKIDNKKDMLNNEKTKNKLINDNWKPRQAYQAVVLFPHPIFNSMQEVLELNPHWEYIKQNISLEVLISIEEGFLAIPQINLSEKVELSERIGISVSNKKIIERQIHERNKFLELISETDILAISNHYVLVRYEEFMDDLNNELYNYSKFVTKGPAISFEKDKFVVKDGNYFFTQGMRIQNDRGRRTNYHQVLVPEFINALLERDSFFTTSILQDHLISLQYGAYSQEEVVVYDKTMKQNPEMYSIRGSRSERIAFAIEQGFVKGDDAGFGVIDDKLVPVSKFLEQKRFDLNWYLELDFGPVENGQRKLKKGVLGKFATIDPEVERFLNYTLNLIDKGEMI